MAIASTFEVGGPAPSDADEGPARLDADVWPAKDVSGLLDDADCRADLLLPLVVADEPPAMMSNPLRGTIVLLARSNCSLVAAPPLRRRPRVKRLVGGVAERHGSL